MGSRRLIPLGTPLPLQVETASLPPPHPSTPLPHPAAHRPPTAVRLEKRWLPVESIRETWRIDDEWWRRPISRLYFTVILENGRLVTLYHDLMEGGWFLQP